MVRAGRLRVEMTRFVKAKAGAKTPGSCGWARLVSANLHHDWGTSSHVSIVQTMVSSQTLPRSTLPDGYPQLLARLKREIGAARTRAALAVNEELIGLYWRIGSEILERQQQEGWGGRVIERLATDLRAEFPEMKGFSRSNVHYMRQFAAAWPDHKNVPQPVGQLPWGHVRCLLDKLDDPAVRLWYAEHAVEQAWSRKLLEHHVATGRYEREGKALTNFSSTLPALESELVRQIVHEDYNFEFLGLAGDVHERRLERSLVAEIERFMIELGAGFAFVGRQVQLDVDGEEFFIDMLFFHIPLNRYVVLELKLGKFRPEYAGQINFYVNVVDGQIRQDHHNATIGLVLCASRNETVARYALNGIDRPVGVARYTPTPALAEQVPEELHNQLPELAEISAGVQLIVDRHADEVAEAEASHGET
jgi:predicted nuclease of restriction endonuclease-like (RecB) superfamily